MTSTLPAPIIDEYDWQFRGACRDADPEMFFLESERGNTRARHVAQAKAVCATCPVLQECLRHGLTVQEPYGIWGGLTVEERREWQRSQTRSRVRTSHDETSTRIAADGVSLS